MCAAALTHTSGFAHFSLSPHFFCSFIAKVTFVIKVYANMESCVLGVYFFILFVLGKGIVV